MHTVILQKCFKFDVIRFTGLFYFLFIYLTKGHNRPLTCQ